MSDTTTRFIMAGCAAIALLVFAYLYVRAIYRTWKLKDADPVPTFNQAYVYVATTLAGVVGGVGAMAFTEKTAGAVLAPEANWDVLVIATTAYVITYLLVGFAAIIAWVKAGDKTPDLVKNLALITIGLVAAVVRTFMNVPNPPPGGNGG